MCRHDRWGISWSLAGRVIRLETGSIPALYLHHSGDCRLQIRPVSEQPGAICILPRGIHNVERRDLRDPGSLRCMENWTESGVGNSRWIIELFGCDQHHLAPLRARKVL
jgi:hypothetical protein